MAMIERSGRFFLLGAAAALALIPACAREQDAAKTTAVEIREYKGEKLDPDHEIP